MGYLEYDSGVPTPPDPAVYELDANGTDTNGSYDMSSVGTPDHTGGEGVVIDASGDGYYRGSIFSEDQITLCVLVNWAAHGGTYVQPVAGRYDRSNGRGYSIGANTDGTPIIHVGYNDGVSSENYGHATVMSTSTDYGICATIDGHNKLANIYLFDGDGDTVGTDITGQAILSGRTFNYSEGNFLIGFWENGGTKDTSFFANGTVKYVELREGIATKTDCSEIIAEAGGSAPPAGPKATDSAFCDCSSPYADLSADQLILQPNIDFCWCVDFSEAVVSTDGPGVAAAQWTAAMTNSIPQTITLTYHAGYDSTKLVFRGTSVAQQRFGELQPASTDPISIGTTDIVDSESNAVDKDGDAGLSVIETYTPVFSVETSPRMANTTNAQETENSSSGQGMVGATPAVEENLVYGSDNITYGSDQVTY
jgi:hypothetical protein